MKKQVYYTKVLATSIIFIYLDLIQSLHIFLITCLFLIWMLRFLKMHNKRYYIFFLSMIFCNRTTLTTFVTLKYDVIKNNIRSLLFLHSDHISTEAFYNIFKYKCCFISNINTMPDKIVCYIYISTTKYSECILKSILIS